MVLRALLSLVLLLAALPLQAEEAEDPRESEFRTQVEAELCPVYEDDDASDEDSDEESEGQDEYSYEPPMCFIRDVAVEGDWAGARQAYERMNDSLYLYQLKDKKWVKIVAQQFPDWENAHEQNPELPEAVFNKLAKKLFPPDEE